MAIDSNMIRSLGMGRHTCPQCLGGSSKEKSLNVWRAGYNVLAKCHRASCGAFGKMPVSPEAYEEAPMWEPHMLELRPFLGERGPLESFDNALFLEKFGFIPEHVEASGQSYVLPIRGPLGEERGVLQRNPHSWGWDRLAISNAPKSLIWKAAAAPMTAWYTATDNDYGPLIVVEDQISAMKVNSLLNLTVVALLGTHMTADAVSEMQAYTDNTVLLALDADATAKAFILARKWGAAFTRCQVRILKQDFKTMPEADIRQSLRYL